MGLAVVESGLISREDAVKIAGHDDEAPMQ